MTATTLAPDAAAPHCASPYVAGGASLVRTKVGEYGRDLLKIALERCDGAEHALTPDLRRLATVLSRPLPWAAVWDPVLAGVERQLTAESPEEVWDAVVPLLVNLAAAGTLAEADLRLYRPQPLWWGGLHLPQSDRLRFRRQPHSVALELSLGRRTEQHILRRGANGLWGCDSLPAAPVLWLGRHPLTIRLYDGSAFDVQYRSPHILERMPPGVPAIFAKVTRLLRRMRPSMLPWIADAIRLLRPVEAGPAGVLGRPEEGFPGLAYMSLPLQPSEVAMRLVHGASHHYFWALARLADLHDGSDKRQYPSPGEERGRTIEMILFDFHALGNGTLFQRDLVACDAHHARAAADSVERALVPLRAMHRHLGQTGALTPAGRALWQPVAERLFS
jgi:HEXXH motif-containing protein